VGTLLLAAGFLIVGVACSDSSENASLPTQREGNSSGDVGIDGQQAPATLATQGSQNSGSVVLAGAGDIADCESSADEATAALLDDIAGTVFTAGDNAYPDGTPSEFADCYNPTWGRHKSRTRPSPGNHDYHTDGAAGYFDYFAAAAGARGEGYYSYELGAWHVVVLNSNCEDLACDGGSVQEEWLRADLEASSAKCTLAYWHHPRFSSGSHGNDDSVSAFWELLYQYDADVVVNGHDHDYERFAPQDPNGESDSERGIREFVVGTGGKSLREFEDIQPNSEVRNSDTFGVIRLTLYPESYDWEFIPAEGDFTDSGSGEACH